MRCDECGGEYVQHAGVLVLHDKYIGPFTVSQLEYMKCANCGDLLFSPAASKKIEAARAEALECVLRSQPLGSFISASEAAAYLGISRQALHKHRRIQRGFIFHTKFSGNTIYLKKSVELFAKTGDGRFTLCQYVISAQYTNKAETILSDLWYALLPPVYPAPIYSFGPKKQTDPSRRYRYVRR